MDGAKKILECNADRRIIIDNEDYRFFGVRIAGRSIRIATGHNLSLSPHGWDQQSLQLEAKQLCPTLVKDSPRNSSRYASLIP